MTKELSVNKNEFLKCITTVLTTIEGDEFILSESTRKEDNRTEQRDECFSDWTEWTYSISTISCPKKEEAYTVESLLEQVERCDEKITSEPSKSNEFVPMESIELQMKDIIRKYPYLNYFIDSIKCFIGYEYDMTRVLQHFTKYFEGCNSEGEKVARLERHLVKAMDCFKEKA